MVDIGLYVGKEQRKGNRKWTQLERYVLTEKEEDASAQPRYHPSRGEENRSILYFPARGGGKRGREATVPVLLSLHHEQLKKTRKKREGSRWHYFRSSYERKKRKGAETLTLALLRQRKGKAHHAKHGRTLPVGRKGEEGKGRSETGAFNHFYAPRADEGKNQNTPPSNLTARRGKKEKRRGLHTFRREFTKKGEASTLPRRALKRGGERRRRKRGRIFFIVPAQAWSRKVSR